MKTSTADQPESSPPKRAWTIRLCVLAMLAAHGPLVGIHLRHLWDRPHYRFVFPLLAIAGWLIHRRWPRGEAFLPAPILERLLLGASVGLLTASLWMNSPYLAAASAIAASGFLILNAAGVRALGPLLAPWLLLWLAVPPPLGYDLMLISRMQALTSRLASSLLDLLQIEHLMAGNVLQLRESTLFVDEACSGVHSLFALLGYTAIFVVVTSRRLSRAVLLLASSFGWSILLNLLRVTMIATADVWWDVDLSSGWPHECLGLATFLIALGLTLSTDQWLHFMGYWFVHLARRALRAFSRADRNPYLTSAGIARRHLEKLRARERALAQCVRPSPLAAALAVCAYSLLFAVHVFGLPSGNRPSWSANPLADVGSELLPPSLAGTSKTGFDRIDRDVMSDLGSVSLVWVYSGSTEEQIRVSLDASFPGWHELSRCYEGHGWRLEEREIVRDEELSWVEAEFSRPGGEHARLAFGLVTIEGRPLAPAAGQGASRFVDRLRDEQCVQVQSFAESGGSVDDRLRREVRASFRFAMSACQATLLKKGSRP